MKALTILIVLAGAAAGLTGQQTARPLIIRNVRIAPDRPPRDILIRQGLIAATGPSGSLARPYDAEVFQGKGLLLGPAFLDAYVPASPPPPPADPALRTAPRSSAPTKPALRSLDDDIDTRRAALDRLHPARRQVDTRVWNPKGDAERLNAGIAWAFYLPTVELCGGSGVLASTRAAPRSLRVLDSDLGLLFALTRRRGRYPSTTMGAIAVHRQLFADAQRQEAWRKARSQTSSGVPRPPFEPGLARINEVLGGRRPAFYVCRTEHEALRILALLAGTKARLVLVGPPRVARAAAAMAKARAGVILQAEFPEVTDPGLRKRLHLAQPKKKLKEKGAPTTDTADPEMRALQDWIRSERRKVRAREKEAVQTFLNAPLRLSQAGVPFAFSTTEKGKGDDLLAYARLAVEAGLSKPSARRALTGADPALPFFRVLEQGARVGHAATFTLLDGPLWDWKTRIKAIVVDGRLQVLTSKPSPRGKKKGGSR
ncbi:MAG TPA: hypothetical protein ENK43_12430 [Planctomycetes bacterium]|nr:hypothetical protein [Planctomycetota bacterium]